MLDITDSNFRVFFRLVSRKCLLYTEMVHTSVILNEKTRNQKLKFFPVEKPLALQLGGSDPEQLALASRIGEQYGYDQINLNCSCPTQQHLSGNNEPCLIMQPALMVECLKRMRESVKIPVTCKCRIGVDDFDSYESFKGLVERVY